MERFLCFAAVLIPMSGSAFASTNKGGLGHLALESSDFAERQSVQRAAF